MKQIDFKYNFFELIYNLKNKFNFLKLLISNVFAFGVCIVTANILFLNNFITDLNLIYDIILYFSLVIIPFDIYNIRKIKKQINEKRKNAELNLNNLVYKLQKENVYINMQSFKNSIQKQEIDYDNKQIHTRFYMLDIRNQVKVLEEIKKFTLLESKECSLFLLDNSDVTIEDEKYKEKLKKKNKILK